MAEIVLKLGPPSHAANALVSYSSHCNVKRSMSLCRYTSLACSMTMYQLWTSTSHNMNHGFDAARDVYFNSETWVEMSGNVKGVTTLHLAWSKLSGCRLLSVSRSISRPWTHGWCLRWWLFVLRNAIMKCFTINLSTLELDLVAQKQVISWNMHVIDWL